MTMTRQCINFSHEKVLFPQFCAFMKKMKTVYVSKHMTFFPQFRKICKLFAPCLNVCSWLVVEYKKHQKYTA